MPDLPNIGARHWAYGAGAALVIILLLLQFLPAIDLWVSALFYDPDLGRFPARFEMPYHLAIRQLVKATALATSIALVAALLWRVVLGRRLFGASRQVVIYLLLAFAIGPGLVTNSILKEHWGRARPSQIDTFGGDSVYTPPLVIADQCVSNCSFVSGDASVGFIFVALGLVARRPGRRAAGFATGLALGGLFGFTRIAQGGHFFSDVVYAALIMAAVAWALHYLIVRRDILALPLMLLRDRA